jgi:signal transduction histidine kinase
MRVRPLVVSLVVVIVAAVPTAVLLAAMDHPQNEIVALVALLVAIALAWLGLTHLATRRDVAGSLRRQYAVGVLVAVGLVLVSVLAGTALMVVSRGDAELVAVMLLFSLIVALRVAGLLSGHAAAQITRLGEGLQRLVAGRGAEPLPETGPRELQDLAIAANAMARDLNASDRARRELLAAVSHDLRTPIAALSLLVDAVADGVVSREEEAEYRARMRLHLAHLRELVDDLFELARLDAGEDVAWVRVPVAVAELVEETAEAFRPAAEERHLTLTGTVGSGLPLVSASPERLQRVLFNLLENAVAHAPHGGAVTLSAARDNGDVRFEVADTGNGIAADEAGRIFDRFYRGGADASRPAGGAGLGLAIARAIVEAHGGRIWVANPGEPGARLAFTVPVHSPA